MIALICLFFPAVISMGLFELLLKTKLARRNWVYRFCVNTLLINSGSLAFMWFVLHKGSQAFFGLMQEPTPSAALTFLIIAVPIAIILGFLEILFAKIATVTVEEKPNA